MDNNTEKPIRLRTQQELFMELAAAEQLADLAQLAVENKILEIAEELGNTFHHKGHYAPYHDSPVLQIRSRLHRPKGRKVPFFVPLTAMPSTWLGKKAVAPVAETGAVEVPDVTGPRGYEPVTPYMEDVVLG